MNEQGYEQTPEQAGDRKRTEAEEAEYEAALAGGYYYY